MKAVEALREYNRIGKEFKHIHPFFSLTKKNPIGEIGFRMFCLKKSMTRNSKMEWLADSLYGEGYGEIESFKVFLAGLEEGLHKGDIGYIAYMKGCEDIFLDDYRLMRWIFKGYKFINKYS